MDFDAPPWAIIWPAVFVWVALFFRRGFDMSTQQRWWAASIWFFISLLPLGGVSLWWAIMSNPAPTTRWIILGFVGAAVGAAGFIALGETFRAKASAISANVNEGPKMAENEGKANAPIINQAPGSAVSINQQGGTIIGTVNVTPSRAMFTPQLGEEFLKNMTDKSKKIILYVIGNAEDQKVGDDIHTFLLRNGYEIKERNNIGMMVPPPDRPFSLTNRVDHYKIVIAASAR